MTYAPKGARPLRLVRQPARVVSVVPNHDYIVNPVDVRSCLICNLPERNWRHFPPPQGVA